MGTILSFFYSLFIKCRQKGQVSSFVILLFCCAPSYAFQGNWGDSSGGDGTYSGTAPFPNLQGAARSICAGMSLGGATRINNIVYIPSAPSDFVGFEDATVFCGLFEPLSQAWGETVFNVDHVPPCEDGSSAFSDVPSAQCEGLSEPKNAGEQCNMTSRPVNILTGNKYYHQVEHRGSGSFPLVIERFYNSYLTNWTWNYMQRLTIIETATPRVVEVYRPNGVYFLFTENGTDWSTDVDLDTRLVTTASGYQLIFNNGAVENYDPDGQLLSVSNRHGLTHTLTYGDNNLLITNSSGNSVTMHLDIQDRVERISIPNQGDYRYQYGNQNQLEVISVPDDTPNQVGSNPFGEDNPHSVIHYENVTLPNYITGFTDENGHRISTVEYNTDGRVTKSEVANGIGRTTLDYTHIDDTNDSRVTVTNELGKDTTYHYTKVHGVRKVTQVEGHSTASCAAANQSYTYDANGYKDLVTDWNGNITDYDYDAQGLETKRIEAKGSPQERVITTQWDTTHRLPLKIIEPRRIVDFTYDSQGLLLERKVTALP